MKMWHACGERLDMMYVKIDDDYWVERWFPPGTRVDQVQYGDVGAVNICPRCRKPVAQETMREEWGL